MRMRMKTQSDPLAGQNDAESDDEDAWTSELYQELYDQNRHAGLSHWLADMLACKFSQAYGQKRIET